MHFLRAIVVTAIILTAASTAVAQTPLDNGGGRRKQETAQVRTVVAGYTGIFGRFIYGRTAFDWPVSRPRVAWVVDEFVAEGRPLGFSFNAYGYSPYGRPVAVGAGWPYAPTGGRDEAPKPPPTPKAESEAALNSGRARWMDGDYAGALAEFKKAVANDLSNGPARLHMALGLLAAGDVKNADKALASGIELLGGPEELTALRLDRLFRHARRREKFEEKLVPGSDGAGALVVALVHHIYGRTARAVTILDGLKKEPAAAKLAGLIR